MVEIETVFAREILDSRGNPTLEVDITLSVMVHSDVRLCHRVHQQVPMKL